MGGPHTSVGIERPVRAVPDSGVQERGPLFESVLYQDTKLTAAQVNALLATNIEVVKAPPAGMAVVPVAVHLFLDHGGTDFIQAAGTDHLAIRYSGGAEIAEIGTEAQFTAFIEASADALLLFQFGAGAAAGEGIVPVAATALDLDNNGATEYTTGDGDLYVRVYYLLVPAEPFV